MSPPHAVTVRSLSFPSVLITITPQSRLCAVSIGFPPKPRFLLASPRRMFVPNVLRLRYRGKCLFLLLLRFFKGHSDTHYRNAYPLYRPSPLILRRSSPPSILSIRLCFSLPSSPFPLDFHFSTAFIVPSDIHARPTRANLLCRVLCTVVVIPYYHFFLIAVA